MCPGFWVHITCSRLFLCKKMIKGTNVLINNLKKEFDVSYGYARRLAVTESARVYSEAQKSNYETNDVEKVLDNEFSIKGQNVVLRKERLDHIVESHSDIGTDVPDVLKRTILEPDLILKDNKNDQTAMFVKKDSINLVNTIVKLSNANNYDNSVITAFRISDKRYNRLLKKNAALLKRDDML